jgi:hypothetical protein
MKRVLSFSIVLFFCNCIVAQNLVPNPGFEVYDTCPNSTGQITYAVPWFQPCTTFSFTHYYNACAAESTLFSVPHNVVGWQYAHTGNAYATISPYCENCEKNKGREYVEVKLLDTLRIGKKYDVSFFVSLGDSSQYGSSNIQCYFSKNIVQSSNSSLPCLCSYKPQISYDTVIMDTMHWTNIKGSFTAIGGEHYLTIGNFLPDSNTKIDSFNIVQPQLGTGYYLDDVSVMEDTLTGVNEIQNKSETIVFPNPSSGIFNLKISNIEYQISNIEIYNVLGERVYQANLKQNTTQINLSNQSNGIYYYKVVDDQGNLLSADKIVIIR